MKTRGDNMKCIFCDIDESKIENTIIEETKYFYILPTLGSLVDGYVLIVTKRHINSMSELNDNELEEYKKIITKYQNLFNKVYKKTPIVFEHGTPNQNSKMKANSVTHAHTHIVNINLKNEKEILEKYNFKEIKNLKEIETNKNYIKYIYNNKIYITYNFPSVSQLMRILIAEELNYKDKFDWKKERFDENIISTIERIKGELK